jgi:hypothetical protein
MLVQTGSLPGSWESFKVAVRIDFVPQDSLRRAIEGFEICTKRALWLNIPGITEEEQLDRFGQ